MAKSTYNTKVLSCYSCDSNKGGGCRNRVGIPGHLIHPTKYDFCVNHSGITKKKVE